MLSLLLYDEMVFFLLEQALVTVTLTSPSVLPFSTVIFFHDIFAPYCSHFVQFFGELALAYNKPRAATVVAESAGVLLSLDAKIFRRVIAQSARGRYDDIFRL